MVIKFEIIVERWCSNNVEFNTNTNAHESWADYPESDQMDTDSSEYYTEDENEEGKIPKGPYHQFQMLTNLLTLHQKLQQH